VAVYSSSHCDEQRDACACVQLHFVSAPLSRHAAELYWRFAPFVRFRPHSLAVAPHSCGVPSSHALAGFLHLFVTVLELHVVRAVWTCPPDERRPFPTPAQSVPRGPSSSDVFLSLLSAQSAFTPWGFRHHFSDGLHHLSEDPRAWGWLWSPAPAPATTVPLDWAGYFGEFSFQLLLATVQCYSQYRLRFLIMQFAALLIFS